MKSRNWLFFSLEDLFKISGTKNLPTKQLCSGGKTPRVSCSAYNNGIEGFYDNSPTENKGCFTVDSGTNGYIMYQPFPFVAAGHVEKLYTEEPISENIGLFTLHVLRWATKNKYNYGYKFTQQRMKAQPVRLPVVKDNKLDYAFMDTYVAKKKEEMISSYKSFFNKWIGSPATTPIPALGAKKWKMFTINNLFQVEQSKTINCTAAGELPYVTATTINNGINAFVDSEEVVKGNCITVDKIKGVSYYQESPFVCSIDALILRNSNLNRYNAHFVTRMIMQHTSKYSYGRKLNMKNLKTGKILLPIKGNGEPDYLYMENYIKNMMLLKYQQYLNTISEY